MPAMSFSESPRVRRFMHFAHKKHKLPIATKGGVGVVVLESKGRLHLLVEVGENARVQALREAIPLLRKWRKRLKEWQGPSNASPEEELLQVLEICQRRRLASYSKLASILNEVVADLLREYSRYRQECIASGCKPGSHRALNRAVLVSDPACFGHAVDIMRVFGLGDHEALEYVLAALRQIENGTAEFTEGYPFWHDDVRYRLRRYRASAKPPTDKDSLGRFVSPLARRVIDRIPGGHSQGD